MKDRLQDIADVQITSPAFGQLLVFQGKNHKMVNPGALAGERNFYLTQNGVMPLLAVSNPLISAMVLYFPLGK